MTFYATQYASKDGIEVLKEFKEKDRDYPV
jgi:hypothetical protein